MAALRGNNSGRLVLRLFAGGSVATALVLFASSAYAYDYGTGSYGSGAYNVGARVPTTTVLTSDPNPSTTGTSVTLTATVTPSSATGTVTFKNGSTTLGSVTLGHASGSLTTSALSAGSHALTAVYAGNVTHSGSTSVVITQVINAAAGSSSSSSAGGGNASSSVSSGAAGSPGGGGGGGGGGRGRTQPAATGPNVGAPSLAPATGEGFIEALIDGKTMSFRDVPVSAWFAPYVRHLLDAGVVSGYRDTQGNPLGRYGPANPVTYAEVAKMAIEASKTAEQPLGPPRNRSARGHWAERYVVLAEQLGFTAYTQVLQVDTPATRGAVVQTLLEALGIPLREAAGSPYNDLRRLHPHARAIATATALGILSGDTLPDGTLTGTVRPDDPVNRAEVAKMVVLVLKAVGK